MKKLIFLLLCIPLISYAQYGESRYVEINVVDQYGNSVGTMSMMARHVDTYSNGYEVAVDRYIQYLKEKETRERAERQRNALNQRLRSLGISEVPSWDTGIYSAAMEGYASGVERNQNSLEYTDSTVYIDKLSGNINSFEAIAIVDVLMSSGKRKKIGYKRVSDGLQSSPLKIINPIEDKDKFKENKLYLREVKNPKWLYLYYEARNMGANVSVSIRDYKNRTIYKREVKNISFWRVLKDIANIYY